MPAVSAAAAPLRSPQNTAALLREYSDLTLYLSRMYGRTHKRFVISDWEGDNSIYCGDADDFALVDQVRANCLSQYQSLYGVASPADAPGYCPAHP